MLRGLDLDHASRIDIVTKRLILFHILFFRSQVGKADIDTQFLQRRVALQRMADMPIHPH